MNRFTDFLYETVGAGNKLFWFMLLEKPDEYLRGEEILGVLIALTISF